jgi:hypothetical protein
MKKIVLSAIVLITTVFSASSQEIVGGFKISPNYGLVFDNNPTKDANNEYPVVGSLGMGVGYYERMNLNDKLELQAEVNYTMHNFNRKISSTSSENNSFWQLSYLDIPVIAKSKLGDLSIGIGLMYRKPLSGIDKNEIVVNNKSTITEKDLEVSSDINFILDFSYKINKMNLGLRLFSGKNNLLETGNPPIYSAFNFGIDLF